MMMMAARQTRLNIEEIASQIHPSAEGRRFRTKPFASLWNWYCTFSVMTFRLGCYSHSHSLGGSSETLSRAVSIVAWEIDYTIKGANLKHWGSAARAWVSAWFVSGRSSEWVYALPKTENPGFGNTDLLITRGRRRGFLRRLILSLGIDKSDELVFGSMQNLVTWWTR